MKIFISWSGKKSRETAEVLRDWIPQVIQAVEPWMSPDIEKGKAWREEIKNKLEEIKFGIVCLTKDNIKAEWLLFEAGALSKTNEAQVCTFLLDLKPTDIKDPLAIYQATEFNREDVFKLIKDINIRLDLSGFKSLDNQVLQKAFEKNWEDLQNKLQTILSHTPSENRGLLRTDRDLLEEILSSIRSTKRPYSNNNLFHNQDYGLPKIYILLSKEIMQNIIRSLSEYLRQNNYPIIKEEIIKVNDYTIYIFHTDNFYDIEELEVVLKKSKFDFMGLGYFKSLNDIIAN